ncbi:DUF6221 family protein [Streptomyces sp. NPDC018055]|uniref:DUF6221 family protein n=1 Tax=Streptomyces sp. NPDC018055 TaxID=3365038 RepID=UPI0037AF0319
MNHPTTPARAEDVLTFLDRVISEREQSAKEACDGGEGRWHSGWREDYFAYPNDEPEEGETIGSGVSDERDRTVVYDEGRPSKAQSIHIALNDPASVLRRCAADRKLIALHGGNMHSCPATDDTGYLDEWTQFSHDDACPVLLHLAEGYGWTERGR